jgi:hypothetical protein
MLIPGSMYVYNSSGTEVEATQAHKVLAKNLRYILMMYIADLESTQGGMTTRSKHDRSTC